VHAATRPSLCPLYFDEGSDEQTSGALRGENAGLCLIVVISRESGVSSAPRSLGSIATVSGILDRPVEPDDNDRASGLFEN
jgi:hypothetical protein